MLSTTLHPTPTGWYVVCASDELAPGDVQRRTVFGREFALFRTRGGRVAMLGARCPHLGADLGEGRVEGETLECPFHRFCFDTAGACVSTPYGKAPPRARTGRLEVRERNGFVLVWWDDAGGEPSWEVPEHPAGFTPPELSVRSFPGHPQETTENTVDVGHFSTVHGFDQVTITSPLRVEGPYLTMSYSFVHGLGPVAWDTSFTAHCWGLGYSFVEVTIPAFRLRTRLFVLALPTAEGQIELRLGASGPDDGTAVGGIAGRAVRALSHWLLRRDAAQDIPIWRSRRHVEQPALARGDGPIGRYRRWAAQFTPSEATPPAAVP